MAGKIHTLQAGGHQMVALGFNEDKPGTPVILLHGIMSSPRFWITTPTPILNEQFRWYALTLPGHYPAKLPKDFKRADFTPEMMADVVVESIGQLVGDMPVILIGHSTGGFAALAVAARHPEMVKSVVSVAGFAQGKWGGILRPLQLLARMGAVGEAMFRMNVRMSGLTRGIFGWMGGFYAADRKAHFASPGLNENLDMLYQDARRLDLRAMGHYFNRMPDIDIREWLGQISAPTLVIAGSNDPIVPPSQSSLIAQLVPDSQLAIIGGAGHMTMTERPEEYAGLVTEWLEQAVDEALGFDSDAA